MEVQVYRCRVQVSRKGEAIPGGGAQHETSKKAMQMNANERK